MPCYSAIVIGYRYTYHNSYSPLFLGYSRIYNAELWLKATHELNIDYHPLYKRRLVLQEIVSSFTKGELTQYMVAYQGTFLVTEINQEVSRKHLMFTPEGSAT